MAKPRAAESANMLGKSIEEVALQIVGIEREADGALGVHTIDIWYSQRRRAWVVERLDAHGSQIGPAFSCAEKADAVSCLSDWLRAHDEAHLIAPHEAAASEMQILNEAA